MTKPRDREEQICREATDIDSPVERGRFIERACANDDALKERIRARLAASEVTADISPRLQAEGAEQSIGQYKLLEKIGEGGNGEVWAAEQRRPVKRRVAVKIIKLGMDTKQVIARFEAERQALAIMDHPNIAKVLDAGATETGRPYFVMELVRGIPFTEYCDQEKLPTQDRLALFIKVCHALQHAHQKGIIHRDIKPSNILVTLHDGVPVPKVIDFGIAKATQHELTEKTVYTQFHQFIGTPAYMSPEQAEMSGLDIDTRSDIYSLGVLLYELLTGSTPFDTGELMQSGLDEMRKMIREREPHRPSTKVEILSDQDKTTTATRHATEPPKLISTLRGDLDWIVMKCLEKDRTRRYETANGLANDLQRHLDNEPIAARPPSTLYKLQKAWRRNKLAFTSTAFIAASVLLALVVSSWSLVRERHARMSEQTQRRVAEEQRQIATDNAREAAEQRQIAERNQAAAEANARRARLNLYAADMNLAHLAIRANNYGRAAELLGRHVPKEGEEDYRHWEWRYLWQQIQGGELYALPTFDHHVFHIDYAPDGRHAAIALYDGRIMIWDLRRRMLVKTLTEEEGSVAKCRFSPNGDVLIGVPGDKGGLRRWDATTYQEQPPLLCPGKAVNVGLRSLDFSKDGGYLAAYGHWRDEDLDKWVHNVLLWDVATGEVLWSHPGNGYTSHMSTLCFSADDTRVYWGDRNGRIRRFDSRTGALDEAWSVQESGGITALNASPDGKLLASGTGYASGDIKLWHAETGELATTLTGHTGWVSWLTFSKDSKTLYSSSADQTARIWDLDSQDSRFILRGHHDELYCLSLSPDETRLATGSKDGSVFVWSTQPREPPKQQVTRALPIEVYFYAPSGEHLFIYNKDRKILELDPITLEDIGIVHEFGRPASFLYSPDSKLVFVGNPEIGTEVYDIKSRRIVRTLDGVIAVHFFPKMQQLISIDFKTREGVFWDIHSWEETMRISFQGETMQGTATSDGRLVALEKQGKAGFVKVSSNTFTGELTPLREFKAHKRALSGLTFSPDDTMLATCSQTGYAYLWNVDDWSQMASLRGHAKGIHGITFSADSRRVITSSGGDDSIKLWDTVSHQEVMTLRASASLVRTPNLVESGRTLAATSWNNGKPMLHVWHAPSWEEIDAVEGHRAN